MNKRDEWTVYGDRVRRLTFPISSTWNALTRPDKEAGMEEFERFMRTMAKSGSASTDNWDLGRVD